MRIQYVKTNRNLSYQGSESTLGEQMSSSNVEEISTTCTFRAWPAYDYASIPIKDIPWADLIKTPMQLSRTSVSSARKCKIPVATLPTVSMQLRVFFQHVDYNKADQDKNFWHDGQKHLLDCALLDCLYLLSLKTDFQRQLKSHLQKSGTVKITSFITDTKNVFFFLQWVKDFFFNLVSNS